MIILLTLPDEGRRDHGQAPLATSLILALGIAGAPLAAYAAAEPAAKSSAYYTKKVCDTVIPTGSRLGGTRRCRTKAELDAAKEESRKTVERVQMLRPSFCPPGLKNDC